MPYSAKLTTRELVLLGLLLAAAVILRLMENILPFPIQIPGARLGLANSVTIIALLLFGTRRTALLLLARLLLVGVISTGLCRRASSSASEGPPAVSPPWRSLFAPDFFHLSASASREPAPIIADSCSQPCFFSSQQHLRPTCRFCWLSQYRRASVRA